MDRRKREPQPETRLVVYQRPVYKHEPRQRLTQLCEVQPFRLGCAAHRLMAQSARDADVPSDHSLMVYPFPFSAANLAGGLSRLQDIAAKQNQPAA